MEPVTHALASLALARAGQKRLPRFGTAMIVAAGLAPDLDFASYFAGPGAFLGLHRAALHSLPGAAVVACATAGAFCAFDKRRRSGGEEDTGASLKFAPALIASAVGVAGHMLLDVASGTGVQLLWPFRAGAYAWDLLTNLDPWILIGLLVGLLLPHLFSMVSEEIGDRRKRVRGRTGSIVTLGLLIAYGGGRAEMHSQAEELLLSHEYHGQVALSVGAFPSSSSVFDWRGVVVTDNTIEEVEVPLGPNTRFDPDRSVAHYKPDDSPALRAGQQAALTQTYLKYARFPLAHVERKEDDYRFEVHDLQFASDDLSPANIFARVDMDSGWHILRQEFVFAASPNP
ncbi:MAG TPA: metal-dependent hydrolase [Candidatus Acidoferrum sp.]|nr:metal-dependent hydrolase [Candidatus Acidoferrum sp.]